MARYPCLFPLFRFYSVIGFYTILCRLAQGVLRILRLCIGSIHVRSPSTQVKAAAAQSRDEDRMSNDEIIV
jgi:hypothetical protein